MSNEQRLGELNEFLQSRPLKNEWGKNVIEVAKTYIEQLEKENDRLRLGIMYAATNTHDDDTWDYLNHLLTNTTEKSTYFRFTKQEDFQQ